MTGSAPASVPWRGQRTRPLVVLLSAGGAAFTLVLLVLGTWNGFFPLPPGDTLVWDRVGDALRSGGPIYFKAQPLTDSFFYAPPWAVAFALVSWLPTWFTHLLLVVAKIGALRLIGGSWVGAGIACWFPLVAVDLGSGSFNLVIAAAIVEAVRGRPRLAVVAALAKFGPLLAIDPRQWRPAAVVLLVSIAVTLPWLWLWPAWVSQLVNNVGTALGPEVPIPVWIRWIAAAALLAIRRPWSRALAATIAIPAFYWASLVVLLAPVAVAIRGRAEALGAEALSADAVSADAVSADAMEAQP